MPFCTQNGGVFHALGKEQTMKNIFVLTVAALALAVFAVPAQAQQVTVPNVVGMTTD
jgi:hypothetical protein